MVVENRLFEVRNISFDYDGEEIFSDISFSIEKGDVLCILGPNGTGKTTLIKCLNGLHDINSGEILINGENIKKLSFKQISKHIGYIPQAHVPSFPFKVFDVVLMGRAPYLNLTDSPKDEDKKIALDALKTLGIEDLKDKEYVEWKGRHVGEPVAKFLSSRIQRAKKSVKNGGDPKVVKGKKPGKNRVEGDNGAYILKRFGIKTAIGAGLYLTSLFMVINGSYNPFLYFRF